MQTIQGTNKTVKLVVSAMMIALGTGISLLCEFIPFLNLPFGGTVTIASALPVILISYLYGLRWGFGSALVYALLQMAVGFRTVSALFLPDSDSSVGPLFALCILFLDYILAFGSLGTGGLFRNRFSRKAALIGGSLVSLGLCYLFHVLSGAIFYGAWAQWFFTESAAKSLPFSPWIMEHCGGALLAWMYSLIYNGCYMIPEMGITALAAASVAKLKFLKKH